MEADPYRKKTTQYLTKWLIDPLVALTHEDSNRARSVALVLLVFFMFSVPLLSLFRLLDLSAGQRLFEVFSVIVFGLLYALSRVGQHRAAIWMVVVTGTVAIFALATPELGGHTHLFTLLIIIIVFSVIFISLHTAIILLLVDVAGLVMFRLFFATGSEADVSLMLLVIFGLFFGLVICIDRWLMPLFLKNAAEHSIYTPTNLVDVQARRERDQTIEALLTDYAYRLGIHTDGSWKFDWIEGAVEEMTGHIVAQITGWKTPDQMSQLAHEDDRFLLLRHLKSVTGGEETITEYRVKTRDGKVRWVRDYARPIKDEGSQDEGSQNVISISGVVQDVTDRLNAEQSVRTYAMQQAVVAELSQHALDLEATVTSIAQAAVLLVTEVLDVEYCVILELMDDEKTLLPRAKVGWSGTTPINVDEEFTHAAYTLTTGAAVVIENLKHDARFREAGYLHESNIVSGAAVIIRGKEKHLGILEVHTITEREFNPSDINFLQAVANVLSAFFQRRRAEEAEREQRVLAETLRDIAATLNSTLEFDEVIDRILAGLHRVVPHDGASLIEVEGNDIRLLRFVGRGEYANLHLEPSNLKVSIEGNEILEQLIYERKPVLFDDVHTYEQWVSLEETWWIRSYLAAPIVFADEVIGILTVDGADVGMFTQRDVDRVLAFVHQASTAIHNAQRTNELEEVVARRTAELYQQTNRLQAILDSTGEGIFYTEAYKILYANETLCKLLGYKVNELVGQTTALLIGQSEMTPNLTSLWDATATRLTSGDIIRSELQIKHKEGHLIDVSVTISKVPGPDDKIYTVAVVRDISDAKRLDAQKSRFIANASHELRSPIASLSTRLYLLRKDPDNFARHVDLLERVVDRMNHLVEDLLDVSRFEHGSIELRKRTVVLQNLIQDVVDMQQTVAVQKDVNLRTNVPDAPVNLHIDPQRMLQVITNLVSNAINYTQAGGHVTISVYTEARQAVIAVADDGIGIDLESQSYIFQPFFQADQDKAGSGLGLSISHEIVVLHGGEIKVESEPGAGSTFYVYLPISM